MAKATKRHELKRYREKIAEVLAKYETSEPVKAALMIADDLLNYRPRMDFTVHHRIAQQMTRLRTGGITARHLLQRICEVWALQQFDQRFESQKVLQNALARHLLQLVPQGTYRPPGTLLRYLGSMILEQFSLFATATCRQIERDGAVRANARKAFNDGWVLAGEKA